MCKQGKVGRVMTKKQKKMLWRILLASGLFLVLKLLPLTGYVRCCLYLIPYGIVGYDILLKAGKGLYHKQPFDECLLMVIATLGAIGIAFYKQEDLDEAVAVMLFYQIGEWFQSYAVGKSRKNIMELMDIRPDYARVYQEDKLVEIDPDEVEVGTVVVVQPGEKIPIDGTVVEGSASLNTSALTGESMPQEVGAGDAVISGCINMTGVLKIQTTKEFEESTVSKILALVEDASSNKSKSENFIAKFARIYTPVVVYAALALAVLPPIYHLLMGTSANWAEWLYRALTFLVISCPCALVISIPLSFFAGIGGAGKAGVLVKGSNYLETLSKVEELVFDKTGTLTQGGFEVVGIHHNALKNAQLLAYVALVESASSHPISKSIQRAYGKELEHWRVSDIEEKSGYGIRGVVDGKLIAVGNEKWMKELGVAYKSCHQVGTILHIAMDGAYAGHMVIADVLKPTTKPALARLKKMGVSHLVMLTGDRREVANHVAVELGIQEFYSELLPEDKVSQLARLLEKKKGKLAFVGDGINDAPVLARADVGIAMGALGSDAAIEAADVVLMDDDPMKIGTAIGIAKKCMRIVYENIYFAIGVKIICLILGALGIANMWWAIFADVGVMVLAVCNAIRAMFYKK